MTHLFRIQELCRDEGLEVYTSPRPALGHIDSATTCGCGTSMRSVSYTAMELGLEIDWFHEWVRPGLGPYLQTRKS